MPSESPIVLQRFTLATGVVGWLLYRSGSMTTPLLVLTDPDMHQLARDYASQVARAAEDGTR